MRRLTRRLTLGILLVAGFSVGCSDGDSAPDRPLEFSLTLGDPMTIGTDDAAFPYLRASENGPIVLWIDEGDGVRDLRVARLRGAAWDTLGTVASGDNWFVNWADVPSVVETESGDLWAHWLEYNGEGTYSYGVRVANSVDGGLTWSDAEWLHEDRSPVEHGFAAMAALPGGVQAVWLDGRQYETGPEQMSVRARMLGAASSTGSAPGASVGNGMAPEIELDGRSCDCCPNDIVGLPDGDAIAAYRDRTEDEIRDIYVVRYVDGVWQAPAAVHADGWKIAACPVNGPALDASGQSVVIAWFTAPDGIPAVNVAFSSDGGEAFSDPVRIDESNPLGRVDVVMLADGSAVVSWLEGPGADGSERAGILARRVAVDGRRSPYSVIVKTEAARGSGYPRMVRSGDELLFAWREAGNGIRTSLASLDTP